jgi:hypothetical protein
MARRTWKDPAGRPGSEETGRPTGPTGWPDRDARNPQGVAQAALAAAPVVRSTASRSAASRIR